MLIKHIILRLMRRHVADCRPRMYEPCDGVNRIANPRTGSLSRDTEGPRADKAESLFIVTFQARTPKVSSRPIRSQCQDTLQTPCLQNKRQISRNWISCDPRWSSWSAENYQNGWSMFRSFVTAIVRSHDEVRLVQRISGRFQIPFNSRRPLLAK